MLTTTFEGLCALCILQIRKRCTNWCKMLNHGTGIKNPSLDSKSCASVFIELRFKIRTVWLQNPHFPLCSPVTACALQLSNRDAVPCDSTAVIQLSDHTQVTLVTAVSHRMVGAALIMPLSTYPDSTIGHWCSGLKTKHSFVAV